MYQMTDIRKTKASKYAIPLATYIVSSGNEVHLYYMLERPIPLFKNVIKQLSNLRRSLVEKIWNDLVTDLYQNKQYESVTQSFRMVGTATKDGDRVRAFKTGGKVSIEYLNGHVWNEKDCVTTFACKSSLKLQEAKEKYPEWYQARIVDGRKRNTWIARRNLYDWWRRKIDEKAAEGHRYFCIMALAIYAQKCGIQREELEKDAFGFIDSFNERGDKEKNPFTEEDVMKALEAYNVDYQTFPRKSIERITAVSIPGNKRNGRKISDHLKIARLARDLNYKDGSWYNKDGAPKKRDLVLDYAKTHPEASQREIADALGISKTTVNKWLKNDIKMT